MNNKSLSFLFILLIALAVLYYYLSTEPKNVPDVSYFPSYSVNSKEVYGTHVFYNLLKKAFPNSKIKVNRELEWANTNIDTPGTVIMLSQESSFNSATLTDMHLYERLLSAGYDIFIICESIDVILRDSSYYRTHDFFSISKDSIYRIGDNASFYLNPKACTADTTFDISYHVGKFNMVNHSIDSIMKTNNGIIFAKLKYNNGGNIYFHSAPFLFSNLSSKQAFYLDHFNQFTSLIRHEKIYITNSFNNSEEADNPFQYVLEVPGFRFGLYTLASMGFLYLFFAGKRKMRALPITTPKQNSFMEYVETVARLYEKQNSNYKLVLKISDNFYNDIYKKYYLRPSDENFIENLIKKSRYHSETLYALVKYFDAIKENKTCSDDQLLQINQYLNVIQNNL